MLQTLRELTSRGVQVISLLALNDKGAPAYDKQIAAALNRMDILTFACTPDQFPRLMAAAIQNQSIQQWLSMEGKG
jgi:hypothetical protein